MSDRNPLLKNRAVEAAHGGDLVPTDVRARPVKALPWLHLGTRMRQRPAVVDLNRAPRATLLKELGLSAGAVDRILAARRKRPIRDLADLGAISGLRQAQIHRLAGRVAGLIVPEAIVLDLALDDGRLFSFKPWALRARFLAPTGGAVAVASLEVRWKGQPFVVQREVTPEENAAGELRLSLDASYGLPPGPVELRLTLYDTLGGAGMRGMEAWTLPSNPLSLFVSPANRSIFNGSVRPDWAPPNWVTAINLSFVNGDAAAVTLQRNMTWKFWDGGVGGSLVESASFTWPETIVVPAFGSYSGWMTFTSPPGSGIFEKYEDMEDMSVEIIFVRSTGAPISGTVTCRIMGGWGINIIMVGDYSGAEQTTIASGVADARDVYENHGLTFSSEEWWSISNADAGGYTTLNDHDEWEDLLDDWTVGNESVDCFVVRGMWDSFAGWSPIPGPDDKDDKGDGLAMTRSLVCFAHELGHYMGGHDHADALGRNNVMHSTCGGRSFTYDQYKDFFDHEWTRIVR